MSTEPEDTPRPPLPGPHRPPTGTPVTPPPATSSAAPGLDPTAAQRPKPGPRNAAGQKAAAAKPATSRTGAQPRTPPTRGPAANQHAADLAPTTAPYTFAPFPTTITADRLWPEDRPESFDPMASFDRLLPNTRSGYLDLTITALSPVHIGPTQDGQPWHWPGTPQPVFGIPGYSLRGMIRARLGALLGGGLGLRDDDPIPILERNPVPDPNVPGSQARVERYRTRRGASGRIGAQRVGLLFRDGENTMYVRECPQFQFTPHAKAQRKIRKVPSVRWQVVRRDLLAPALGQQPDDDARKLLREWRGKPVWVVWAEVTVAGVPRPVAAAIGHTAEHALAQAQTHRTTTLGPETFRHFLDADWRPAGPTPHARPMRLFPTHIAGLDRDGLGTVDQKTKRMNPAACYLLEPPNGTLPGGHEPAQGRLPVTPEALAALEQILGGQYWDHMPKPADNYDTGWPVFFDAAPDDSAVVRLGGSGGFAIRAEHTVRETVQYAQGAHAQDNWTNRITVTPADNDAVIALLGAVEGNNQIAARLSIGHATARGKPKPLRAETVPLLSPNPQAAHTRLRPAPDGATPTYSDRAPRYRGREIYWHRGVWSGTGADGWAAAANDHRAVAEETGNQDAPPAVSDKVGTPVAPLPIGTTFLARISFTNLTDPELGALLFALRFPDEQNPSGAPAFAHKVGGGQPLGLGSVHITATTHFLTADRYIDLAAPGIADGDGTNAIAAFLRAVGWRTEDADDTWVPIAETGRSWPAHVAAVLTASRWRNRPAPVHTATVGVKKHRFKRPMLEVFDVPHPRD